MIRTSEIARPVEYMTSILPLSSVVSSLSDPSTPLAWVLNHGDYSLGTLYTAESARRRGLGRKVVEHRLERASVRGFCYVGQGNHASQGLWKSLGWEKSWSVAWVFLD